MSTTSGGRTPEHFFLDDDNDLDEISRHLDFEMCDGDAEVIHLSSMGASASNGCDEDEFPRQLESEMCDGNAEVIDLSSVGASVPNGGPDGIRFHETVCLS